MRKEIRRQLDQGSWREVMARFDGARETVGEFCAREGLSVSSFYRWRERLRSNAGSPAASGPSASSQPGVQPAAVAAGFIDLGSLAGASCGAGVALELRLDLGAGLVLQIVRR